MAEGKRCCRDRPGFEPEYVATWSFRSFQNLFVKFVEFTAHDCHREISL